jgi:hypothetical protein
MLFAEELLIPRSQYPSVWVIIRAAMPHISATLAHRIAIPIEHAMNLGVLA